MRGLFVGICVMLTSSRFPSIVCKMFECVFWGAERLSFPAFHLRHDILSPAIPKEVPWAGHIIPLLIAFVTSYLNKVFDTVSREGLYAAQEKNSCSSKLLMLLKSFYEGMHGVVFFNGQLLDAFKIQRGVRLDCVLLWTVLFFFRKVLQNFVEGILYLLPWSQFWV